MNILEQANRAFQSKNYPLSIELYLQLLQDSPEMESMIRFNLNYAKMKENIISIKNSQNPMLFRGHVDSKDNNTLRGWYVDQSCPARIFDITVYVDEKFVGKTKNFLPRPDLFMYGISGGKGGFIFKIPSEILESSTYTVTLYYPDNSCMARIEMSSALEIHPVPTTLEEIQPVWYPGAIELNPDTSTVLLCAHASGQFLFGGERSFLDVLDALNHLGLNVIVTLPNSDNKKYMTLIQSKSIGVYVFSYGWFGKRPADQSVVKVFCKIIEDHNVSIVYSNTIVLMEPALAAKQMGKLSVVHIRELIMLDDALRDIIGLPIEIIIKNIFERYDFLIANSKATERLFLKRDCTFYVPNAVSASEVFSENNLGDTIVFGIISSNNHSKGISDFVNVAIACQDLKENAKFCVIGPENGDVPLWKQEIKDGVLPDNISFLGYRDTPKAAISEINVLLNLSHFAESFGRTVAEAMAAKRAVIAYEWGAIPELVIHGETGFLATYRDVDGIAQHVRKLCADRELIRQFGEAGYKRVTACFSHDVLVSHMQKAMDSIQKYKK